MGKKQNYEKRSKMARMSKGRQERQTKEIIKHIYGSSQEKEVMERAMNSRREKFEEYIMEEPVFKNLNPMQKCAVLSFRHHIVEEKDRLAQIDGYEKGILDCMTAVLNVLFYDYWPKSGEKKIRKFTKEVISLMDSNLVNAVTWEEMAKDIERITGVQMHCDWMGKDARPTLESIFEGKKCLKK